MPYADLPNGLRVHYQQIGTGPDVAFIHGIGGHLGVWHFKILPRLWDSFNTLTYDLRGHGRTTMTEVGYSPTQMAEDLRLLLDVLRIEKVDLVGHSFGADIGLYFAFLYPERLRKAILIEPLVPAIVPTLTRRDLGAASWGAKVLGRFGISIPKDRRLDAEYIIREATKLDNKWGPLKDMARSEERTQWFIKLCTTTSLLKDCIEIGDLTLDRLSEIRVPIHLIYDSGSVLWRKSHAVLSESLPNATSVLLNTGTEELAHFMPLESPDILAEHIIDALQRPLPVSN